MPCKLTDQQLVTIAAARWGMKQWTPCAGGETTDQRPQAKTTDETYDRYYKQRSNTLSLQACNAGDVVKGKLLVKTSS
jgi:hypothetical protein